MAIEAKVICDSVSKSGKRITTFVVKYPRFLLPELNTHRVFSRSTASNRAIPSKKLMESILQDPALPIFWGKNQSGMKASQEISSQEIDRAKMIIIGMLQNSVQAVKELVMKTNLHKQTANRYLEPFTYSTSIITATEWDNFYNLRRHSAAQPEIKALADAMFEAQQNSVPKTLRDGEYHLPFVSEEEKNNLSLATQLKCSVARCARVSYLNHDGSSPDVGRDCELHDRLLKDFHMSPCEHQATPLTFKLKVKLWYRRTFKNQNTDSNFKGWVQYRKTIDNEHIALPEERTNV